MSRSQRIQTQRLLREAEGYLELKMPKQALAVVDRLADPGTSRGTALYLRGEALRMLHRYRTALAPLEDAADLSPSNIQIWLALGWCFKRTGQLRMAIAAIDKALDVQPFQPLLHYNLACYYSLAGEKQRAIRSLSNALDLDEDYRYLVADEPDFDSLRANPEFLSLTSIIV